MNSDLLATRESRQQRPFLPCRPWLEGQEEEPVQDKEELLKLLQDSIARHKEFCSDRGIDLGALLEGQDVFKSIGKFDEYDDVFELIVDYASKGLKWAA